jgi:hypothetical protein
MSEQMNEEMCLEEAATLKPGDFVIANDDLGEGLTKGKKYEVLELLTNELIKIRNNIGISWYDFAWFDRGKVVSLEELEGMIC